MPQTASRAVPPAPVDWWAVFEIPAAAPGAPSSRHVVGTLRETGRAQVSAALVAFDPATGCAHAASGVVYRLSLLPGPDFAARYVWARWKQRKGVKQELDLTRSVFAAMNASRVQNDNETARPALA